MNDIEIAYIAGLFDGEGDVGLYWYTASKNGKRYQKLTARIHNTHQDALQWVARTLGVGKVFPDRRGIKRSGNPARKQCYVYVTAHRQARTFLEMILPFLIIKKDKANESLQGDRDYSRRTRLG